ILGFAQLLDLDDLPADRKESVAQILRGGSHLLALINEVLDIARIEAGHLSLSMEPVHALEIVDLGVELVRPLAAPRGITIAIDRGSTFWIELARTDAPQAQPAPREHRRRTAEVQRNTRGLVLYIEDNRSNVRLMQRVLERRPGVRLVHAPDGRSGLAMAA